MIHRSPLRYPGGKTQLTEFLGAVIASQPNRPSTYVEPFAGGAGAACALLLRFDVDRIVLNDLNPGLAAFWRVIADGAEELVERVLSTRATLDEWHRQRSVYLAATRGSGTDVAFATFFLNRTNHSGILSARPIGGLKQDGKWKLDARWNPERLADRLRLLGTYASRIEVHELDALEFLRRMRGRDDEFIYADPPYLDKGAELYLSDLTMEDHRAIAAELRAHHGRWMVTYDVDDRVLSDLYPDGAAATFELAHTAALQHVGQELVVFAPGMTVPGIESINKGRGTELRSAIA